MPISTLRIAAAQEKRGIFSLCIVSSDFMNLRSLSFGIMSDAASTCRITSECMPTPDPMFMTLASTVSNSSFVGLRCSLLCPYAAV